MKIDGKHIFGHVPARKRRVRAPRRAALVRATDFVGSTTAPPAVLLPWFATERRRVTE